jgi:hypothetical protein
MAIVNFGTFSDAKEVALGAVDAPADITLSGASQQSSPFGATAVRVRIVGDAALRYRVGADPDATDGFLLPANVVEYVSLESGRSWKLAVIQV